MRARGFTLIEVAVGMAVAAIILLLARGIVDAVSDTSTRLTRTAAMHDEYATAEIALREMVATSEDSSDADWSASTATLETRCATPGGWRERCTARIAIERESLIVTAGARRSIPLVTGARVAALLYLESARDGGVWRPSWPSGRNRPLAIGIASDRDTVVLPMRPGAWR